MVSYTNWYCSPCVCTLVHDILHQLVPVFFPSHFLYHLVGCDWIEWKLRDMQGSCTPHRGRILTIKRRACHSSSHNLQSIWTLTDRQINQQTCWPHERLTGSTGRLVTRLHGVTSHEATGINMNVVQVRISTYSERANCVLLQYVILGTETCRLQTGHSHVLQHVLGKWYHSTASPDTHQTFLMD
jgi:hypothetical protein